MLGSFPLFSDFKLGRFAGGGMRRAVATFPRLCKPCLGITAGGGGGHKHVSGAKRPVTQLLFQVLSDDDRQTDAIGSLRANTPSSREAAAAACKALRRCLGATAAADVCAGASILLAGRCREFMPWAGSQAQKPPPPTVTASPQAEAAPASGHKGEPPPTPGRT